MKVRISEDFRVAYKKLKKRHKSLQADFEKLLNSLFENPFQGVELEGGARKVRLAISSKGRGKSGGARVITYNVKQIADDEVVITLMTIYDKSEISNVSDTYIRSLVQLIEK